jgi:hypothetical protein
MGDGPSKPPRGAGLGHRRARTRKRALVIGAQLLGVAAIVVIAIASLSSGEGLRDALGLPNARPFFDLDDRGDVKGARADSSSDDAARSPRSVTAAARKRTLTARPSGATTSRRDEASARRRARVRPRAVDEPRRSPPRSSPEGPSRGDSPGGAPATPQEESRPGEPANGRDRDEDDDDRGRGRGRGHNDDGDNGGKRRGRGGDDVRDEKERRAGPHGEERDRGRGHGQGRGGS